MIDRCCDIPPFQGCPGLDLVEWLGRCPNLGYATLSGSDYVQQSEFGVAVSRVDSVLQAIPEDSLGGLSSEADALLEYNTQYLKDRLTKPVRKGAR